MVKKSKDSIKKKIIINEEKINLFLLFKKFLKYFTLKKMEK